MKRFVFLVLFPFTGNAQFAPAAGQPGSTAIKKDSNIIVNWANMCRITRGLQDISNVGSGYASFGDSAAAIGPADGSDVVSLGDGGYAVLTFPQHIKNGSGPDFCVFENAFNPGFLELGFVEASSDGVNYTRFPATCNVQNTLQIGPFDTSSEPSKINNLAGKYIASYGVPFDLQELAGSPGLDVDHITHIKIIDVVGCIQPSYARYDKNNNVINDLWATAFASGGFDLDAVGVIHQQPVGLKENISRLGASIFYFDNIISVAGAGKVNYDVIDMKGNIILQGTGDENFVIGVEGIPPGLYLVRLTNGTAAEQRKIVK